MIEQEGRLYTTVELRQISIFTIKNCIQMLKKADTQENIIFYWGHA